MPSIRNLIAAVLALVTVSADAGLVYRYSTKSTALGARDLVGSTWIDGDKRRVELDPDPSNPRPFDVSITVKGETTFINLQNKTFYKQRPVSSRRVSSLHFHLPMIEDDSIRGHPKITYRNAGPGPLISEYATTKHVIELRYQLRGELAGERLQGGVDAVITVLAAPALPRQEEEPAARTGFPEIDDELARLYAPMEGMIVRHEVSVNRRLHRGAIINEHTIWSIDELKEIDVEESLFVIPSGLTYQEPVIGVPGR